MRTHIHARFYALQVVDYIAVRCLHSAVEIAYGGQRSRVHEQDCRDFQVFSVIVRHTISSGEDGSAGSISLMFKHTLSLQLGYRHAQWNHVPDAIALIGQCHS